MDEKDEALSRAHPLVQHLAKLIAENFSATWPTCELCEERPVPQGEQYCLTCAARFVPCAYCGEPANLATSVTVEGKVGIAEYHPDCHPALRDE